ncbi:alpha/beta fold hydrolase [Hymenobacter sp. BT559]|uniref:alpha/beta fold hydrolase n=1 Tax=Hymenobacter sp. BT559 TaxID=2795729 RepID=UPI0018EE430A|nr:alpha/beta fold hydrolase [Hymenobacter sp. BT559]MBJ6142401.1 alpha/beta fold hydrolase [Hymenobacter sp. BT559]
MTPLVFIPGLLCTAELFTPQLAALWPHGPVMVASTLQGDTIAEMATAILAQAPPQFALVGLSMGGMISLEIMRQAPQRVLKLALLDTSAQPASPEQAIFFRGLLDQARSEDAATVLGETLISVLHPAHQHDPALRAVNQRMGAAVGLAGFAHQVEVVLSRPDSRPSLAAIAVPTLVLVGEQDQLTPPDAARELAAGIPHASLIIIPDCGHGSTIEQPQAVNDALLSWLLD